MALPNITTGAIFSVTFDGRCFGQQVMNKFYYKVGVTSAGPDPFAALFEALDAQLSVVLGMYTRYRLMLPSNWDATINRYQVLSPDRLVAFDVDKVGLHGTNTFETLTANVAACITRRGSFANRHNIASTHILRTEDAAFITDGKLTALAKGALSLFKGHLTTSLDIATDSGDTNLIPVIFNKNIPADSVPVTSTLTQETVRVMRRRTLGIGS